MDITNNSMDFRIHCYWNIDLWDYNKTLIVLPEKSDFLWTIRAKLLQVRLFLQESLILQSQQFQNIYKRDFI